MSQIGYATLKDSNRINQMEAIDLDRAKTCILILNYIYKE